MLTIAGYRRAAHDRRVLCERMLFFHTKTPPGGSQLSLIFAGGQVHLQYCDRGDGQARRPQVYHRRDDLLFALVQRGH